MADSFKVSIRQCRYCKYYKMAPHKITWDLNVEEIQFYDGYCRVNGLMQHLKAGDCCYMFVKKTQVGPVLGAYNKGAKE